MVPAKWCKWVVESARACCESKSEVPLWAMPASKHRDDSWGSSLRLGLGPTENTLSSALIHPGALAVPGPRKAQAPTLCLLSCAGCSLTSSAADYVGCGRAQVLCAWTVSIKGFLLQEPAGIEIWGIRGRMDCVGCCEPLCTIEGRQNNLRLGFSNLLGLCERKESPLGWSGNLRES